MNNEVIIVAWAVSGYLFWFASLYVAEQNRNIEEWIGKRRFLKIGGIGWIITLVVSPIIIVLGPIMIVPFLIVVAIWRFA